ncbi:SdpI family protein [Bacillus sp. 1P06AnD]|uniref:SdpI family protein n=1 Tax=Bacillus sp. 1P06AnD TaxID=3132208 RepID=UPI0039A1B474
MTRKIDSMLITTTFVCLLPIILGLFVYNKLPDQIAIHWNSSGSPDNFAPKVLAVWGLPILLAGINLFSQFMVKNDPKKANSSTVLKQLGRWIIPILSVIIIPITLFKALGYDIPIQIITPAMVGIVMIICGNYLPKCKQNYTIGIKLPWTLNSTENWNKTHHMAGYLWMAGGVCLIVGIFLNVNWLPLTLIVAAVLVLIPTIYSYFLFKKGV